MTLPADKLDAVLAGVLRCEGHVVSIDASLRRCEAMLTGPDGRAAGGIAVQAARLEPVVCDMDAQLRRIAVDVAELQGLVGQLPSKTLLVILLLATAGGVWIFGL